MYRQMKTRPQRPLVRNRLAGLFNAAAAEIENEPFRHDLVARVRRAIADGTYETPEKWQAALDRLGEDLR